MLLKGAPGLTAMRLYLYVYTVYVQLFHSELNNMIGWVHWPGLGFPACLGTSILMMVEGVTCLVLF